MAIKGKYNRRTYKKYRTSKSHRKTRTCITTTRKCLSLRKMRGGNYESDITTRITDGIPTKPLNKFVVTVPGYGTMSGTSYKKLMESIDRDGPDAFLK